MPPAWQKITLILSATALAASCAVGAEETSEYEDDGGVITGVGGGSGGDMSAPSSSSSTGGMGGDVGTGGMGGAGMGGAGGGTGNCVFDHVETCQTAELLPKVAGDKNGAVVTRTGVASRWFQILVEEDDGNILEEDLSYTVTLTNPAGMDYDLIIHQGGQDDPPNCNATPKLGDDQGGVETVSDGWDDDQFPFGEDDSVWLNIEVRYISGSGCDPADEWTLEIEGHT